MTTSSLPKFIIIILIWFLPGYSWSQLNQGSNIDWVDSVFNVIKTNENLDSKTKSDLTDSAFQICKLEKDICRQIYARIVQATYLDNLGLADSALIQLYWASKNFQSKCDSVTFMHLLSNLTNIYLSLGELKRVDSVGKIVLSLWNSEWEDKEYRFLTLTNLAIAHAQREEIDSGTEYFRQTFKEAEAAHNQKYVLISLNNLGSIKGMTGDLDSAYFFLSTAAGRAKEVDDMDNYMSILINLANLDGERGMYDRAVSLLDDAYEIADTLKNKEKLAQIQRARADLFAHSHDYKKAHQFLKNYIEIHDQYLNEERVKAVTEMMEKYESEKKARQIQQLEIEKLDAAVKNERIANTRNRYLFIGIAVLLVAIGLWSRLRYVHKSRIAIQREKDISEGLLLNILPSSVADELKLKGHAEAKLHETATILFSDFKSFTTIAEEMNAVDLVEEINTCFKTFDEIITRYGVEKIKTIGDSYMAAASVPATNKANALDIVSAALEMQQFVIHRKKERERQQLPSFEMRVGAHSGPVVAGIVGVKKFQYDLWGDTVNIASRMETAGEVDRVNISEATYQLVKENPSFKFTYRGMISVKGKGEMAMYFVDNQSPVTQN